uniref:NADH-ubiquinone oxidoreductase chain 5 n=1 Tax=Paralepetopsis sp. TaxID=3071116 RepID=A0AA96HTN2_9GAST|nr:NADH dehydrogenase subunit 5 [Paralepetopsis sp.]
MISNLNTTKTSFLFLASATLALIPLSLFLMMKNKSFVIELELLSISSTQISIPFILDPVGVTFSFIVCLISSSVMAFSIYYMHTDQFKNRFSFMVMIFVGSMNLLIYIPSLITLLLGWDGLGIISFALVIYYQNSSSLAAGMITALSNRVGDIMILISIALTVSQGHWNIMSMWHHSLPPLTTTSLTMCIMVAGMTKSAQLPFSAWLPAAMAAPTPVSALVHSSTLVTAGVFILIRFFYFLEQTQAFTQALLFISVLTTLMAGLAANMENDLKKIIALSTLSQLGVMMSSLALSLPMLALFHLFTHALFKALLFICAGTIIHENLNTQDIRHLGSVWCSLPITTINLNIANLSLCGAPFLSGFYSKDLVLENFLFMNTNTIMVIMMYLATALTASYSVRLTLGVLWDHKKTPSPTYKDTPESLAQVVAPMATLTFCAITMGHVLQKTFMVFVNTPFITQTNKLFIPVALSSGLWLGFILFSFQKNPKSQTNQSLPLFFMSLMWFSQDLSSQGTMKPTLSNFKSIVKSLDQGWVETSLSQALKTSTSIAVQANHHITNNLPIYAFPQLVVLITLFLLYLTP